VIARDITVSGNGNGDRMGIILTNRSIYSKDAKPFSIEKGFCVVYFIQNMIIEFQ